MIIEVEGSAEQPYKVDTENLTCTCPNFRFKCRHFSMDNPDRLCKHLHEVFEKHPELKPASLNKQESLMANGGVEKDGKTRYPREVFDLYTKDIRNLLEQYSTDVQKFEFCGSYRRLCSRVSDLDVLMVMHEGKTPDALFDYCEQILGYEKLWRGEKKASYTIDGYVQVDFKVVPLESWAFATLHYTGSKETNIKMRRRACDMGLSLSEYGFKDRDGNPIEGNFDTEKSIFNYLQLEYKEPWDR